MSDKTTAPAAPQRVALYNKPDGVAVVFPADRNKGALSFGALKPGVIYVVSPEEAARLTSDKRSPQHRFDLADAPAAPKKAISVDKE